VAFRALIVVLIVGVAGAWAWQLGTRRALSAAPPALARLPDRLAAWSSEDFQLSDNTAAVLAADATLQRVYRHPSGATVALFVAYFSEQQVNAQIHSPRHCVPGSGWKIVTMEPQTLRGERGPEPVTRMLITRNEQTQELIYWFRTRGGTVSGEYALKWEQLKSALARRPTDAVFVRYHAPTEHAAAMHDLMAQLDPALDAILAEVGL
jgi:EpsI family protein